VIDTNDHQLIGQVISTFTRQNEALLDQITSIGYYMRGHYSRDDIWSLTFVEREKDIEFLNKRMEDAKEMMKNGVQVFI